MFEPFDRKVQHIKKQQAHSNRLHDDLLLLDDLRGRRRLHARYVISKN